MRAPGIHAFAALIGQRGDPAPREQRAQPAGQIAADHVAIARILRPARDQLRQHCPAPSKTALHRIFQIEQAQVILAPLAHHHWRAAIGACFRPCAAALAPLWDFPALLKVILLMGVNVIVIPLVYVIVIVLVNQRAVMQEYRAEWWRNAVLLAGLVTSIVLAVDKAPQYYRTLFG